MLSAAVWGACSPGGGRVDASSVEYRPEDLGTVDVKLDEQIAEEITYFDPKKDADLGAGEALNSAAGIRTGSVEEGIKHIPAALAVLPPWDAAEVQVASTLAGAGKKDLAARHYQRALEINPQNDAARKGLAALEH